MPLWFVACRSLSYKRSSLWSINLYTTADYRLCYTKTDYPVVCDEYLNSVERRAERLALVIKMRSDSPRNDQDSDRIPVSCRAWQTTTTTILSDRTNGHGLFYEHAHELGNKVAQSTKPRVVIFKMD